MADNKQRFSPAVLLTDGALLLCALLGLTGSFLSLYGGREVWGGQLSALNRCALLYGEELPLWAALCALLGLAAWSTPRFQWTAGGLSALWAAVSLANREAMGRGLGVTVREISLLFSWRVDWGRPLLEDLGLTPAQELAAVRLSLTLALGALGLLLGWAVVRARRWWLVLALTLPPLLPGLLADLYPDWPPFMALAACWCAMLLTDLCKWAAPSGRWRLTLAVFPAVALTLALITLAFPREGYTRPAWARKAQEDLMNLTSRLADYLPRWEDGPFKNTVTYVGSAGEADLANAGPLNYSGRTVLRLNSDYDGRLYLRGTSLAAYEDGVWKALPDGTWQAYQDYLGTVDGLPPQPDSPLVLPSLTSEHRRTYTATVDNVGAVGACVYAPYFLTEQDWEGAGVLPVEDAYLARKQGQWTHTVEFADLTLSNGGSHGYTPYQDYVYEHYLDVPEGLADTLGQFVRMWYSALPHRPGQDDAPVQLAEGLADFLSTFCEYDTSAPAAPEGVDPVLYFLNESRRGYCMHYASAVTLLLRAMGVPARYASGFTAVSVPGRQVDVPDRAAHAWVEVWVDGFGWYPVEVTPAAAFAYEQGPEPLDPITLPPMEPTPGPEPTATAGPEPTATPAPSDAPGGPDGPAGEGPSAPDSGAALAAARVLAAIAVVCALLWLGQYLPKRRRARLLARPDGKRTALYGYRCLLAMKRWGGRVDDRAVELAEKAKYSRDGLSPEELDELRALVDRERGRLCVVLRPIPRLTARYWWGRPGQSAPPPEPPG